MADPIKQRTAVPRNRYVGSRGRRFDVPCARRSVLRLVPALGDHLTDEVWKAVTLLLAGLVAPTPEHVPERHTLRAVRRIAHEDAELLHGDAAVRDGAHDALLQAEDTVDHSTDLVERWGVSAGALLQRRHPLQRRARPLCRSHYDRAGAFTNLSVRLHQAGVLEIVRLDSLVRL